MLGDILKRDIHKLSCAKKRNGDNTFWIILRNIAVEEIMEYGDCIDSDTIIPIYYEIMRENIECIPLYYRKKLPSNQQERFRIVLRNLFSSNAFHCNGLANQEGIIAYREVNERKKGKRIVYKKA